MNKQKKTSKTFKSEDEGKQGKLSGSPLNMYI